MTFDYLLNPFSYVASRISVTVILSKSSAMSLLPIVAPYVRHKFLLKKRARTCGLFSYFTKVPYISTVYPT